MKIRRKKKWNTELSQTVESQENDQTWGDKVKHEGNVGEKKTDGTL